ncbi:unnamed protein product [Rotaria socialis]|uniref:Cux N-terminal domain-containing protein n=1 Tax=Rotaria socialis TaxID=392032 RepID=A0A819ZXB6_9BILA|nr:unnamed protein product [Rotaria socialis]
MTTTSKNNESIVKQWTSIDLKSMQHDLDVTTIEIVSCADESDQSRRKLVELTRDFKKNANEVGGSSYFFLYPPFLIDH